MTCYEYHVVVGLRRRNGCCVACCAGAAAGGADAEKKEKAPKGGTAVKVTSITPANTSHMTSRGLFLKSCLAQRKLNLNEK